MRLSICALALAALTIPAATLAYADDASENHSALASQAAPVATSQSADDGEPAKSGEQWRFKRHNGQWWYWLPSETWVVWSGEKWVDPAQLQGSQSRRSYSYDRSGRRSNTGYWDLGRWGPVYYDSYGNRQYPYSMRKRGIRQLGVIPAPGGVRALPGWGGER